MLTETNNDRDDGKRILDYESTQSFNPDPIFLSYFRFSHYAALVTIPVALLPWSFLRTVAILFAWITLPILFSAWSEYARDELADRRRYRRLAVTATILQGSVFVIWTFRDTVLP
jgi:hypothetical protein